MTKLFDQISALKHTWNVVFYDGNGICVCEHDFDGFLCFNVFKNVLIAQKSYLERYNLNWYLSSVSKTKKTHKTSVYQILFINKHVFTTFT